MGKQKHSESLKDNPILLSVALATYNEGQNIGPCLESVKMIAGEIVIIDGTSSDNTVGIAKKYGAKVTVADNPPIFHINKQKAIEQCHGKWILQLDADERVSPKLLDEIREVIQMSDAEIEKYQLRLKKRQLFLRHQSLLIKRDGNIGTKEGSYGAFFVPRLNYFLGKYLRYGGVYPDGVIRLIKNGHAYLPAKNVHEQMVVNGRIGWLENDLLHYADTTFTKYLYRNSKYIDLIAKDLLEDKNPVSVAGMVNYFIIKPFSWFLLTQIRHKGILDGYQGIIFSLFSALRFPRAYWRYLFNR